VADDEDADAAHEEGNSRQCVNMISDIPIVNHGQIESFNFTIQVESYQKCHFCV
jgi:hypothetical protein